MSIYYNASKIYHRIKKIPAVGPVCKKLSPIMKRLLLKIGDAETERESINLLAQSMMLMKNSFTEEIGKIKKEFSDIYADRAVVNMLHDKIEKTNINIKSQDAQICGYITAQNERIDNYCQQVQAFKDRVEFIRIEILEIINASRGKKNKSASKSVIIKDHGKLNNMISSGNVLLNLGCGHKQLENYINIDKRDLPNVDIVADISNLPFEECSVNEIYSAHLVEHFTVLDLENNILPYWFSLLSDNGIIKIIIPDIEAMIIEFNLGQINFNDLKEVIFGAQDYDDDFHFSMFSPDSIKKIMMSSGFKFVDIKERNRKNGKCLEMEVWGRKF